MYKKFVDNAIKNFSVINKFIAAHFNIDMCNFYLLGFNNKNNKYIITELHCYFSKFGEKELTYEYNTEIDNYYEEYDECINEFIKLIK